MTKEINKISVESPSLTPPLPSFPHPGSSDPYSHFTIPEVALQVHVQGLINHKVLGYKKKIRNPLKSFRSSSSSCNNPTIYTLTNTKTSKTIGKTNFYHNIHLMVLLENSPPYWNIYSRFNKCSQIIQIIRFVSRIRSRGQGQLLSYWFCPILNHVLPKPHKVLVRHDPVCSFPKQKCKLDDINLWYSLLLL